MKSDRLFHIYISALLTTRLGKNLDIFYGIRLKYVRYRYVRYGTVNNSSGIVEGDEKKEDVKTYF
jgi:hypothetical protein